ncbi:MAG: NUDIX domain-containing protein [Hymenobacter sp.]|nr:MAG: NUDIX domain-containing protein [Hymenobacter sp.]
MYDLLVFIGRFQPLHRGHQEVIERARKLSKNVLVLVGSAGVARSARNPFTWKERRQMINNIYPDVIVDCVHDHTYNDNAWILEVQQKVENLRSLIGDNAKIGLIGHAKDHTSYYLKLFPDWHSENVEQVSPLNSTAIREMLWSSQDRHEKQEWAAIMDTRVFDWLMEFRHSPEGAQLRMEYEYLVEYRKKYGEGPFLTADALVQVGGKILLVTRGKEYGHGLLAMPGGFVNKYERFQDAYIRELREETNLRVPVPVLRGSTKSGRDFDEPHRSARGRLVTKCYHVHLQNDVTTPEVRGGDDADHADWYDLAWILENEDKFFEDHYHIIKSMLGIN